MLAVDEWRHLHLQSFIAKRLSHRGFLPRACGDFGGLGIRDTTHCFFSLAHSLWLVFLENIKAARPVDADESRYVTLLSRMGALIRNVFVLTMFPVQQRASSLQNMHQLSETMRGL